MSEGLVYLDGRMIPARKATISVLSPTVKYGIKNIKWLSSIRFQDSRPADYWAERGYDWFSGL